MNQKYSDKNTSNYLYVLNQTMFTPLFAKQETTYLGVPHFSDIPYVFNEAKTRYSFLATPSDVKLSTEISSSWASFAASGNPSGKPGTITNWPDASDQVSSNQYNLRVLGGPNDGLTSISNDKDSYEQLIERCDFWTSAEVFQQMAV
jgi:carboxylesterase type B